VIYKIVARSNAFLDHPSEIIPSFGDMESANELTMTQFRPFGNENTTFITSTAF